MIIRYSSTMALREDYLRVKPELDRQGYHRSSSDGNSRWFNNESEADSLRFAEYGNTTLVPQAEAFLKKLDQVIETPRPVWDRSPAGAFCSVPDYIVGLPTPMRRQVHQQDEHAPITILVTTTSSAGVDAKTLEKRGIVILALVMALSRIRPVSLQQLAFMDGYRDKSGETIITSEINTSPLDLATACYVLTSAGFARRLTYGIGKAHNDFSGGWPRAFRYSFSSDTDNTYHNYLKQTLVADPTKCLLIGESKLGDELLATPLTWINKQITRFTTQEEEELV